MTKCDIYTYIYIYISIHIHATYEEGRQEEGEGGGGRGRGRPRFSIRSIYYIVYIYIERERERERERSRSPAFLNSGCPLMALVDILMELSHLGDRHTPSPPTKSFPTKSPWVKLSGRLPIQLYGYDSSHPLELRVCLSKTLRNPNS